MTAGAPPRGLPIEFSGLTKHFGPVLAVDHLTFTVEPGRVTGFLGPNGSGKTTTLRMLLGLVHPSEGTATIGGRDYADLEHPSSTVGAVLEATSFHPARRARTHLRMVARAGGPDSAAGLRSASPSSTSTSYAIPSIEICSFKRDTSQSIRRLRGCGCCP